MTPQENFAALLNKHGLTITAVFVPYSRSVNAKQPKPWPSLNWTVTLRRNGRDITTGPYAQGEGHAPAYKQMRREGAGRTDTIYAREKIDAQLETGRGVTPPSPVDVWAAYANDCDVLNAGGFEQWADGLGFDRDSRKAEDAPEPLLIAAAEWLAALADYPVADEADFSELEWSEAAEYWEQMSVRDRAELIRESKCGASIYAARRDTLPDDDSGALMDRLRS